MTSKYIFNYFAYGLSFYVYFSFMFQIENTTLLLNLSHIYYIMFYIYYKELIYSRLIIVLMYVLYLFYSFARYLFFGKLGEMTLQKSIID